MITELVCPLQSQVRNPWQQVSQAEGSGLGRGQVLMAQLELPAVQTEPEDSQVVFPVPGCGGGRRRFGL
jgi:hypothetical protein